MRYRLKPLNEKVVERVHCAVLVLFRKDQESMALISCHKSVLVLPLCQNTLRRRPR